MTLTAEDLKELAETYADARLNADTPEDKEVGELMCELIRLAQLGAALSTTGGAAGINTFSSTGGHGGANGSH